MQAAQMKPFRIEAGETTDPGLIQVRTARREGMDGIERLEWR